MEEAGYYAAIAVLIAFGLLRRQSVGALDGPRRAARPGRDHDRRCDVLGPDRRRSPSSLPMASISREMGVRLGALLLFGSALGVVSAIGGRRRAEKASTRLF